MYRKALKGELDRLSKLLPNIKFYSGEELI